MDPARDPLLRTPGLTEFLDAPVPAGQTAYVDGAGPGFDVRIVPPDPSWPEQAREVIGRIRAVLGPVALDLEADSRGTPADRPAAARSWCSDARTHAA